MPSFAYRAVDRKGAVRSGHLNAANENVARARLETMDLHIMALAPAEPARGGTGNGRASGIGAISLSRRRTRLSSKELTLFSRQLASLVQVTPLEELLRSLSHQHERPHVRRILANVHAGIVEGQRFADALGREAASFPALYRAMIAAGETSGALDAISARLALLLERQARMRGKLIGALAYPAILALVALLVVAALMIAVVPRVVEQFEDSRQQLPLITLAVMRLSHFLAAYWHIILGGIALAALMLWQAVRIDAVRMRVDRVLLRLPFIGRLLRNLHAARMARTLATMVSSRLPLLDGLVLTGATIHNRALVAANADMVEMVRTGSSLAVAMRSTGMFPPVLLNLVASGEASGQLGDMLERAADYLEQEFDNFTATALALLEPIIIVIMGAVVALIILSILLPILQLQNLTGI